MVSETAFFAHSTACIDDGAVIGDGTRIWHFSHIMSDCEIGERCNFGQNVVVSPGCRIGNNVKIQNNVSVYTGVILEDDVFCGPSMVFTNVINPRSFIERKTEYRTTRVGRGASIGANATVLCGSTIGKYALIAAGSVVTRDVPDYGLIIGNPGRLRGFVCYCGDTLPGSQRAEPGAQTASRIRGDLELACPACARRYLLTGTQLELVKS